MKRGATEAETARLNGWNIGTRLVGDEGYGPTEIVVTYIGDTMVVCRWPFGDSTTTFECRDWQVVV